MVERNEIIVVESVLNLDLIEEFVEVFLGVWFGDGLLGIQTFGFLLLSEVDKWVGSYSDGLDTEKEKLFLGLSYEDVFVVKCGDGLLGDGDGLVFGDGVGLLLFLLCLDFS
jgi:hypothetical protein